MKMVRKTTKLTQFYRKNVFLQLYRIAGIASSAFVRGPSLTSGAVGNRTTWRQNLNKKWASK